MIARATALALAAALALPAAAAAKERRFHTPSGNIHCLYASSGPFLRCDVLSLNDTAFTLDRRHRGKRVHVTDSVFGSHSRTLAYGDSIRLGAFRCTSRRAGLTCRSKPSGHGFRLSRHRQTVF
ncbi:MAG TPA: DUF6636 domain-containing protein [Thermoleophilaceae bacterium]